MSDFMANMVRRIRAYREKCQAWLNVIAVRDTCILGKDVKLLGNASIVNHAKDLNAIIVEDQACILGSLCTFCENARIRIGKETYIGPNSNIMAFQSIDIGSRVQISHGVNIYDNNSHSLSASARYQHMRTILEEGHPSHIDDVDRSAVVIEDDAWIGFGATVLKGVHIGKGAVVGARSVITHDVPAYSVVVGSPQKIIGMARP